MRRQLTQLVALSASVTATLLPAQSPVGKAVCRDYVAPVDRTDPSAARPTATQPSDSRLFLLTILKCSRAPGADLGRAWRSLPAASETHLQLLAKSNEISSVELALALSQLASLRSESDSVRLYALTALAGQAYPYAAYPSARSFVEQARRGGSVAGFTHSRATGSAGDWPAGARARVSSQLASLALTDPDSAIRTTARYVKQHLALDSLMRAPEAQRYKPKP
jgi:hypothetical protein